MRTITGFILGILFLLASCNEILKDDELSLQRYPYFGNEIKIDGYYYREILNYNEEFLNVHILRTKKNNLKNFMQ